MRWIWLLTWLALCFAAAGVGGLWTASEIPGWYCTLTRSMISPPNWVFGQISRRVPRFHKRGSAP